MFFLFGIFLGILLLLMEKLAKYIKSKNWKEKKKKKKNPWFGQLSVPVNVKSHNDAYIGK